MKIAIIGENYYPTVGGIQEHMYNQARCLRDAGHDARIVTGMPEVTRWIGPQDAPWVHRIGRSVRYGVMGTVTNFTIGPRAARNLHKLFRDERFDLIHVHNPCDFGLPLLAYQLYNGKKVATLHSAFNHSFGRSLISPYYRRILRSTDCLIAVSELAAASMRRYADFPYRIVPNGVNVSCFSQGRRLARYDDGRKNILYLGRFEPRNGLDQLLAALPAVVHCHPDCRVLIAGAARDGSTREYEHLVPPACRENVLFLGIVEDQERADLYACADLFVLPARFGGSFSIMVLEALAAGTPIVSTPFVSREYRGKHWDTVYLCDDYSPAAIGKKINDALAADNAERIARGREIAAEYDWQSVTRQICMIYEQTIAS